MKLVKSYVDVLPVVVAGKVDEMLIVDAYCSRSELASAILSSAIQPRSSPTRDPDGVGAGKAFADVMQCTQSQERRDVWLRR
jgi:hypothetical protein